MKQKARRIAEAAAFLVLCCAVLSAGEAAPAPQAPGAAGEAAAAMKNVINWTLKLDPFTLTLIFLILATIIGTLLKGRSRDRCYKRMRYFPIRLVLDDRTVNGRLTVGNAGIELEPDKPEMGPFGARTGFLLPRGELGRVRTMYRVLGRLSAAERRARDAMMRQVRKPGIARRIGRFFTNLAGSFKDAFTELFSVLMGRLNANLGTLKSQQAYITRVQQGVVEAVPNASYDAILERLRGLRVEVELNLPNVPPRVSAVLDEYTAANLSLFDVRMPVDKAPFEVVEKDGRKLVRNPGERPITLPWAGWTEVGAGEEKSVSPPPEGAQAFFIETADAVFPRGNAQARYRLGDDEAPGDRANR
ncbi:MAG TPA: hypothetical protein ENN09_06205 [Planctomycetes bacterium]|nr:hypothetical protein [Planctomycetota bacterium]